jgi:hypothetical protein
MLIWIELCRAWPKAMAIAVCAVVLTATAAVAQCSAGAAIIGGRQMQCPARICVQPGLGDLAKGGRGLVLLDPRLFMYPPAVQQFVFSHECAHAQGYTDEQAADCQAICWAKQAGSLNISMLRQICASVFFFPGDWTHFPGPARCNIMATCFYNC